MEFWQRVHWFFTSACNERCRFCFKPDFNCGDGRKCQKLAEILSDNGVREVIFTGGEPLLSKRLEDGLRILHENKIYTSIHSNVMLLNDQRLGGLVPILDEVALPIDSVNRRTQEYLRNIDCLPQTRRVLKQLQETPLKIGIHTVATEFNMNGIPAIYNFLLKHRFDFWKVYDFNPDIVVDRYSSVNRFQEIESLRGNGPGETDGGVNLLFAKFLLMEEKMSRFQDKRIRFVGAHDYDRDPYFFLDSNGEVYTATWFSQGRKPMGNLITQGFSEVRDRSIEELSKGPLYDEEAFIETEQDRPLWARAAWEGNLFSEELEEVGLRYVRRFVHLSKLYLARLKMQGYAPEDAELNFDYSV